MRLTAKIYLVSGAILLVCIGIAAFIYSSYSMEKGKKALVDKGTTVARYVALSLVKPIRDQNPVEIQRMIDSIAEIAVCEAMVAETADGAKYESWGGSRKIPKEGVSSSQHLDGVEVSEFEGTETIAFSMPIVDRATKDTLGKLVVTYSKLALGEENHSLMITTVLVATAAFLASLVGLNILLRKILVSPVKQLALASNQIAKGEKNVSVRYSAVDEIGELTASFNTMAAKLKSYSDNMEMLVAERTRELSIANKRVERIMAEREKFLRAISHDLASPMRNIIGLIDLALKNMPHAESSVVDYLHRARSNASHTADMATQILELAKIRTTRHRVVHVNLGTIVNEVLDTFSAQIIEKKIKIVFDRDSFPVLYCEPIRIRQVFQNLIDNAIKYIGTPEVPTIEISVSQNQEYYQFCLRDNGVGIPERDRERLFFAFRRGTSEETLKVTGKGIGLATIRAVVESYDGDIWYESNPGLGTAFYFTLSKDIVLSSEQPKTATLLDTRY